MAADLDADELVGTAALLLMAGHEATVNVIGNGVLALLAPPRPVAPAGRPTRSWTRRPSRSSSASTRRCSCSSARRCATPPSPGTRFPPARKVAALLGAAAHDPAGLRPARPSWTSAAQPNPHLGFGLGVHYCLGAPLARLEVAAVLDALRRRMPGLALAAPPRRRPDFVMRGFTISRLTA